MVMHMMMTVDLIIVHSIVLFNFQYFISMMTDDNRVVIPYANNDTEMYDNGYFLSYLPVH